MKPLIAMIFAASMAAHGYDYSQMPWNSGQGYSRAVQTSPAWWVKNDVGHSDLYQNGVYLSTEYGSWDMDFSGAWRLHSRGNSVAVIDASGSHGQMCVDIVKQASPSSVVEFVEAPRLYEYVVAQCISNVVDAGRCKIISLSTGWSVPDESLRQAIDYAGEYGVLLVCAAPNVDGDLDNGFVDYPYAWHQPNVLVVNIVGMDGQPFPNIFCRGSRCIGAAGRIMPAAGMYGTGTSFATPTIAGLCALIRSARPDISPEETINAIRESAANQVANAANALDRAMRTFYLVVEPDNAFGFVIETSCDLKTWEPIATNVLTLKYIRGDEPFRVFRTKNH